MQYENVSSESVALVVKVLRYIGFALCRFCMVK